MRHRNRWKDNQTQRPLPLDEESGCFLCVENLTLGVSYAVKDEHFTPNGMELLALRHRKKLALKIVYRILMTGAGYWLYSKPGVLTFLLATAGSKTVLSEGVACASSR